MAAKRTVRDRTRTGKDRISVTLTVIYAGMLLVAVAIFVKLAVIQLTFDVHPDLVKYFKPLDEQRTETPKRGSILDHNGNYLAISTPMYQIYMDCTVRKKEFENKGDDAAEAEWKSKARELSKGLALIYGDKSADEYYKYIIDGRNNNRQHAIIGKLVDRKTLGRLRELPLFKEGAFKGGIIVETVDTRQYPYGALAYRVIGYVKDNSKAGKNSHIGIEGKYDHVLHGQEGKIWLKVTDKRQRIRNLDSTYVRAVDGKDVRTTLDINLQDITDRALRKQITEDDNIEGALAILMDVKTGAIRSMVNLQRDSAKGSPLRESYNLAISQVGEQGSVFKTVALMSLIEDGYVKSLSQEIPSNGGALLKFTPDKHVREYEAKTGKKTVPVGYGLQVSSNYVFGTLVLNAYGDNPQRFYDRLYSYRFGDQFDFDIDGLGKPRLYTPDMEGWSKTTLATASYGYSLAVTPLHVAMFYNAIANGGLLMKPYLIEDFEKNGQVTERRKPIVLNSICSKATADTLTKGLMAVTVKGGTAPVLEKAKMKVAGKTGTAQVALRPDEHPLKGDAYHDEEGRWKNKGTFVGFFPAEDPRYTILISVYSKLSHRSFYGGTAPAKAILEIVDTIYALEESGEDALERKAVLPAAEPSFRADSTDGLVPDVKGMGLMDAVFQIENNGYRCTYEGSGHVASQTPAAGKALDRGETIHIVLK